MLFTGALWVLIACCLLLYMYTRASTTCPADPGFRRLQKTYLTVYLLAMAGDWVQGPYIYALYEHYSMGTHEIEILFVAGFGSSVLFGTFIGAFADQYGRRMNCALYGLLYGLSCLTKHFNNFYILMLGRLLGGVATSILYSAFESWLVCEYKKHNFDGDLLGCIFSQAVLGNSLVAILAGIAAQQSADLFGYVSPFDISLALLVLMVVVMMCTWPENYGDSSVSLKHSFSSALRVIHKDSRVLYLGLVQSLFEGSMYTFVLEWTPALSHPEPLEHEISPQRHALDAGSEKTPIPHGYIFAGFMVAIMIGSSLFKLLLKYTNIESFLRVVLLVSAVSLSMPIFFPGNQFCIYAGFIIFEICVGIFWPAVSSMRSEYLPEATRATIMNVFRVPLNLIVIIILIQNFSMSVIFTLCVVFLLMATVCQHCLYRMKMTLSVSAETLVPEEDELSAST